MQELIVHPRIPCKHPELSETDIKEAWQNAYYEAIRPDSPNFPEYLWIGKDRKGRDIEMVGTLTENGWLIYHANTPISKSVKIEIERSERRR